ncbi:carbohydrate ABC transporter permease [Fundicoccus ignavus]|uniref:ABC transporter permease subunit n=1 Tax=Fundicoccus ignavus TaxID=2664442 RepID=A0A844C137_9LACT|nr:sugar ABC transporter permease [Fundicoccus ignavus]MRJ46852.1 ABC transporter permease subunit [Fundicoccus ignavus]
MEETLQNRKWRPYLFILPSILIICVFSIYPIFRMIYQSFHDWNMITDMKFVGLANFEKLFTNPKFYQILGNTFFFVFWNVLFCMVIALLLAVYLQKDTKINRFLQSISFMPYIVSMASVALLWSWIMNRDYGFLNYILTLFGLDTQNWLGDRDLAKTSLVIISVWKSVGYNALILISALQGIPRYLYEAASLDNASQLTVFRKITFPMISPTLFFITIVNIINSFKVFELVQIMTNGGPLNSTKTLVFSIHEEGTLFFKVGYASAIGVVLLVILAVFTIVYFRMLAKRVHYQ